MHVCRSVQDKERKTQADRSDEDEAVGNGLGGESGAQRLEDSIDKYNANRILHHVVRRSLALQSGSPSVGTGG